MPPSNDPVLAEDALEDLWGSFRPLADAQFIVEFCSGNETQLLERFSEMYLSRQLLEQGLQLSSNDHGPDIRIDTFEPPVWLEMVTPAIGQGPNRLPEEYADPDVADSAVAVYSVPHEAILLRWTSSIRQKWEKFEEYKAEAIVSNHDPCVIAVNSIQLRHAGFDGISQFPVAIEAVYPIGPQQVHFDKETLEVVGQDLAYRPEIINANQSSIPTDLFLDQAYSSISAVLAFHKKPEHLVHEGGRDMIVVHNINASNQIPHGMFATAQEFWLEPVSDEEYRICSDPP